MIIYNNCYIILFYYYINIIIIYNLYLNNCLFVMKIERERDMKKEREKRLVSLSFFITKRQLSSVKWTSIAGSCLKVLAVFKSTNEHTDVYLKRMHNKTEADDSAGSLFNADLMLIL